MTEFTEIQANTKSPNYELMTLACSTTAALSLTGSLDQGRGTKFECCIFMKHHPTNPVEYTFKVRIVASLQIINLYELHRW